MAILGRFLPCSWRPSLCARSMLFSPWERPRRREKKLKTCFSDSNQVCVLPSSIPKYSRLYHRNLLFASPLEAFTSATSRDRPRRESSPGLGARCVFCNYSISPSSNAIFADKVSTYFSVADCLCLIAFISDDIMDRPCSILGTVSRICCIWEAPVTGPVLLATSLDNNSFSLDRTLVLTTFLYNAKHLEFYEYKKHLQQLLGHYMWIKNRILER